MRIRRVRPPLPDTQEDRHSRGIDLIVGPCRCRGCGQEVVYVRDGYRRGWLHANGRLRCWPALVAA